MKRMDLASKLARKEKISRAQAADRLDGVVHRILRDLRQGRVANLPGLGTLKPGLKPRFLSDGAAARPSNPKGTC